MRETGKPRAGPPGLSVWSLLSWASWELGGEAWGCLGATMPPPQPCTGSGMGQVLKHHLLRNEPYLTLGSAANPVGTVRN